MKKKILICIMLLVLILSSACMKNDESDKGIGVVLSRSGDKVVCEPEEDLEAAEIKIKGTISTKNIKLNDENMGLIAEEENYIKVYVVAKQGKIKNIIEIVDVDDPLEVILEEKVNKIEPKLLNIKKNVQEVLLGDFNDDGEVGLADFNILAENFKTYSSKYDIGPANLGTDKWENIYAYAEQDGKLDLWDLIIFVKNFGKTKPISGDIEPVDIVITGVKDLNLGESNTINSKVKYSDGSFKTIDVAWTISQGETQNTYSASEVLFEATNPGVVKISTSYLELSKELSFVVMEDKLEDLKIYIESDTAPQLYAWTGQTPNETKLLGEWPGSDLTEKEGEFYVYDFGTEYESINYIHFIGGQSADLSTDKSIWILSDGTISPVNPYEPSKPIIEIDKKAGTINGDTEISVSVTATNNTVDSIDVTFNGEALTLEGEKLTFKLSDLIENGESGILYVSASNSEGVSTKSVEYTRDDTVTGLKLYMEESAIVYAWVVENGEVKNLNGDWPGKELTTTEESAGRTWYVMDFGMVDTANFILNGQGGTDQSLSSSMWIDSNGGKYNVDPYIPTKPTITINPGTGIYNDSKDKREISIKVSARNAEIETQTAVLEFEDGTEKSLNLSGEENVFDFSDNIADKTTATLTVTASNEVGETVKTVELTRDDEYKVPKGEFTWDNAMVYFVMTDRFYNGNPENDNSYGRQNNLGADPLDIATFHGGDVAGLTTKIEEGYFDELGVNVIWVTALYEQIHGWVGGGSGDFPHYSYHGYYALDWTMADKNMGTIEEMREFVNVAHEHEIRVVMDIVLNHAGYNSAMDMVDYGFGSYDADVITDRDWMHPLEPSAWQSHHEEIVFYEDSQRSAGTNPTPISDWLNWWGPDWIRTGIDGYDEGDGSELESPLLGLPDLRTEITEAVDMAPIMQTKWGMETSGYEDWIVPAAKSLRNPNAKIAPADHVIKSLAAWVEEFGIDGFRCDTAKHIELSRWKQLKEESAAALERWRANNPDAPGANWDEDFWMVGEWWDFKLGWDKGVYENGFDAMIDFGFPLKNGNGDLGATWQAYSGATNKVMPYINSHDMGKVGFFGKGANCIPAGTALVLNPGPVQLFYGDENDRPKGPTCSDPDHPIRSDYIWGDNPEKLAHWQKLGKFRNMNPAVGAGIQTDIGNDTYLREWEDNKVVIKANATGLTEVEVAEVWADGTKLRNAYNGELATVEDGIVEFTGENDIILIEEVR